MLQHAYQQTAHDVNHHNQNTGDGVATNKLTRTVHRAVEVGFLSHFRTTLFRLIFTDKTGIKVSVNRHLLTRHPVEDEARAHFSDTPGTFSDDHKVDDDENNEHHDTDSKVTANQEVAKRFNDLPRRRRAGVPFHQNDTSGSHVQRQTQQRGEQQNGRKGGKLQRALGEHRHQQYHNRQRDIKGKQQVEDERRQRQDHHRQDQQDEDWPGKDLPLRGFHVVGQAQHRNQISHR